MNINVTLVGGWLLKEVAPARPVRPNHMTHVVHCTSRSELLHALYLRGNSESAFAIVALDQRQQQPSLQTCNLSLCRGDRRQYPMLNRMGDDHIGFEKLSTQELSE